MKFAILRDCGWGMGYELLTEDGCLIEKGTHSECRHAAEKFGYIIK